MKKRLPARHLARAKRRNIRHPRPTRRPYHHSRTLFAKALYISLHPSGEVAVFVPARPEIPSLKTRIGLPRGGHGLAGVSGGCCHRLQRLDLRFSPVFYKISHGFLRQFLAILSRLSNVGGLIALVHSMTCHPARLYRARVFAMPRAKAAFSNGGTIWPRPK